MPKRRTTRLTESAPPVAQDVAEADQSLMRRQMAVEQAICQMYRPAPGLLTAEDGQGCYVENVFDGYAIVRKGDLHASLRG
jgi:hypothetical protein